MSKWSEEFEEQHKKIGKLKKDTEEYEKMEREKLWIHKEKEKLGFKPVKKRESFWKK